jgi:hypothetical protein
MSSITVITAAISGITSEEDCDVNVLSQIEQLARQLAVAVSEGDKDAVREFCELLFNSDLFKTLCVAATACDAGTQTVKKMLYAAATNAPAPRELFLLNAEALSEYIR